MSEVTVTITITEDEMQGLFRIVRSRSLMIVSEMDVAKPEDRLLGRLYDAAKKEWAVRKDEEGSKPRAKTTRSTTATQKKRR